MEYGGNPFNPNQQAMKQPVPFAQLPLLPEAMSQFTPQESEALKNQFMNTQFPNGLPKILQGPFPGSGGMGGIF